MIIIDRNRNFWLFFTYLVFSWDFQNLWANPVWKHKIVRTNSVILQLFMNILKQILVLSILNQQKQNTYCKSWQLAILIWTFRYITLLTQFSDIIIFNWLWNTSQIKSNWIKSDKNNWTIEAECIERLRIIRLSVKFTATVVLKK